jgi:anti-sigma-K factor RskA
MERQGTHDLSAAYALDALDVEEERAFERHLARCAQCREDVASFHEIAAALAYDVPAPLPPPALRQRILELAGSERPKIVPIRERRRWALPLAGGAAAAAACLAIALGIWAAFLNSELGERAEVFPVSGANGSLVVTPDGEATLVVSGLERAPVGKAYEIWVIEGETPRRAGLFAGAQGRTAVVLTRPVSEGDVVAVTLEVARGVDKPTGRVLFTAETA